MGSYEGAKKIEQKTNEVNVTIKNEFLPHSDHPRVKGTRKEKLQSLLAAQNYDHLSSAEKEALFKVILEHDELFVLYPSEIGKIDAPPAKIEVENLSPVRGPTYRYPEKAKEIISKLIKDMEKKGVIEPRM